MKIRLDSLDGLFSEYVRKRAIQRAGGCERCLSERFDIQKDNGIIFPAWKQLQCAHFHGRGDRSTRWDEDNAVGLCGACHFYFGAHPLEFVEWFRKHLGEREFDMLAARNRVLGRPDRKAIELYLREKIGEKLASPSRG
jgi:hypothetical protein